MRIKKLIYQIKPPCGKCPYMLEHIQTTANPCPQCKLNHYHDYEVFKKQLIEKYSGNEN